MLVMAPLRRRPAARSQVGHLLCSEKQRVLTYLLLMLAFASRSVGVQVLTRLGLRHGWLAPSSVIVVMILFVLALLGRAHPRPDG
jgi:hypothetical protein